jgi:hypothetical protein
MILTANSDLHLQLQIEITLTKIKLEKIQAIQTNTGSITRTCKITR